MTPALHENCMQETARVRTGLQSDGRRTVVKYPRVATTQIGVTELPPILKSARPVLECLGCGPTRPITYISFH